MKEIKKEDIVNLSYKDIAFLVIENDKKSYNTLDLFTKIIKMLELPENTIDSKIADFYTSLTTDKRFVLVDGMWDLRTRHTSDKVLSNVEDEEDEETDEEQMLDNEDVYGDEEEEANFDEVVDDDEAAYDDDDDDLADLVVIDEDEIDLENN